MKTRPRQKSKMEQVHEMIVKDEQEFAAVLEDFRPYQIKNVIDLFITMYKKEKLALKGRNSQDRGLKKFMILREMEIMYAKDDPSKNIQNILDILRGKNITKHLNKIRKKMVNLKKIEQKYGFLLSGKPGVLHKKGKVTRKHLIRDANETLQFFGQVKNNNMSLTFKKQKFSDFECHLETRNQVLQKMEVQKKQKKDKVGFFKILKWPVGEKKAKQKECRVRFVQFGSKRQYALYYHDRERAQKIKDNCVFQRYRVDNDRGNAIMKKIKFIWKIKQAEYFYQNKIKSQFGDIRKAKQMKEFTQKIKQGTQKYLKLNYPNLYESNYDAHNAINFEDGSHLNVMKSKRRVTMTADPSQFATVVDPNDIFEPDQEELEKLRIFSPFEDIQDEVVVNQALLLDNLETFEKKPYVPQIRSRNVKGIVETLSQNSVMILNFNKIIIDNVFSHEECHLDQSEIDNLIFQVNCAIDKGNHSAMSMTFAEEHTSEYISFDIDSSFLVNLKSLQNIKITLTNKMNQTVLYDNLIDITPKIDTLSLENYFEQGFEFKYKGLQLQGNINFVVILLPRNLEVSHLLLNKKLIDLNFQKFQELLNNIQDYTGYKSHFISKQYEVQQRKQQTQDFFFFYNNFLNRNFDSVEHQENMLLNSSKPQNYEETIKLLKKIIKNKLDQKQLLQKPVEMIKNNAQKKLDSFYDMIIKVASLVSSKERLLLISFLKNFRHSNYVCEQAFKQNPGFNNAEIKIINSETQKYFQKYNYLTQPEKFLAQNLIYQTYIIMENNFIQNQNRPIYFSTHYIPLIIKFTQLNMRDTSEEDILTMIVNQISAQIYFKNYSIQNNLQHLDRALVFAKLLFKKLYQNEYITLMKYMISFDDILLRGFMNSYADVFDTINFSVYCDFKNLLYTIFLAQKNSVKVLDYLDQLEITFHIFIDVCFVVLSLKNQIDNFRSLEPEVFLDQIKQALYSSQNDFITIFSQILELINDLIYQDFLFKEFAFLIQSIHPRNNMISRSFKILQSNIQSLKLSTEQIKKLIHNEVTKDTVFVNRALTLYSNNKKNTAVTDDDEENEESEEEEEFNDILNQELLEKSMINEDIYFEIAQEFNEFEDEMDGLEKQAQQNYKNAILYLNNINVETARKAQITNKDENLHTFRSYNMSQFYRYCQEILKCSDQMKTEIYQNISRLVGKEDISLMNFIIILICTYTEDQNEISKAITYFSQQLSSIYLGKSEENQHFTEIVQFINQEIYSLLPISYHRDFLIKFHNKSDCFVRTARIILEKNQIDVTELTIKHFILNTNIQGKKCLHFNRAFCKDLERIFKIMMQNEEIEYELTRFELLIDIENQGNPKSLNISFKIQLLPQVSIFCKYRNPVFFPKDYSINNMIKDDVISNIYLKSPLCFNRQISTLKSSMRFMNKRFNFSLIYNDKAFITINTAFKQKNERLCVSQVQWNYSVQKSHTLVEYSISNLAIDLPYCCFFMPVGDVKKAIFGLILKNLKREEILKFVQLYNSKCYIQNEKGKNIDNNLLMIDLKSYQEIENTEKDFGIKIVFKI